MGLRWVLGGAVKLAAVVAVGGAFGVVAGRAASSLGGEATGDSLAGAALASKRPIAATATAATAARAPSTATVAEAPPTVTASNVADVTTTPAAPAPAASTGTRSHAAGGVRIHVFSAVMHPAGTAAGRRRQRARVSMHVRVTNGRPGPMTSPPPVLLAGSDSVVGRPDDDDDRVLVLPVAPGARAQGRLRFETAGAQTAAIVAGGRAALRVAGVTIAVPVRIGSRVSPR